MKDFCEILYWVGFTDTYSENWSLVTII